MVAHVLDDADRNVDGDAEVLVGGWAGCGILRV